MLLGIWALKLKLKDLYKSTNDKDSYDGISLIGEDKKVELENELLSVFNLE